jgi:very-short-patch-repair endonuclease
VDPALAPVLRRQHGVVTREQALAVGLTRHAVAHRVERGWWRRALPGTYVVAGLDEGAASRCWAAVLWAPAGACLSHDTAAALHGLPVLGGDAPVHLSMSGRGRDCPAGLAVHRLASPLDAADVATRQGLPVTGGTRTALDVARRLPESRRAGFLIACAQQRLVTPAQLASAAERGGRRYLSLRRLLAALDPAAQSDSERTARMLLTGAGLAVEAQVAVRLPVGTVHLDLAIRATRIAIEVDGIPHHSGVDAVLRDRQRDELLREAGWEVVRVMPHELARPEVFIARVWRLHALRLAAQQVPEPV